jgi:hypothetical protein
MRAPLTARRLANILASRCATEHSGEGKWQGDYGGRVWEAIDVSGVHSRPDGGYGFSVVMQKLNRFTKTAKIAHLWSVRIEVTPDLDVIVEETHGKVPPNIHALLACAFEE